jgi:HlyD family secretion protein
VTHVNRFFRRLPIVFTAAVVVALVAYALWPRPVEVDLAHVERGDLRVTVDEDGVTRIREKYVVSAPLAGRLARVTLDAGDEVVAGETVLAAIDPTDPSLLDPRARAEAQARIRAAEAALERAQAELTRIGAALELAQNDLVRVRDAANRGAANKRELDEAVAAATMRAQESHAAEFGLEVARFELEQARAAMLHSTDASEAGDWRFEIRAPISGRVLRVLQESAAVVQPGTPLLEIGDPRNLEVVVDVLTSDAVGIRPGTAVTLEHWGGEVPLNGNVRLIEPAAFTKISALGVEEQRVNVIIDLTDPPAQRKALGDGYRVEARILTREAMNVLIVPTGALFRHADSWALYVVSAGRARRRDVQLGHRSGSEAQILSGLDERESVIVYPSDRVADGARVSARAK